MTVKPNRRLDCDCQSSLVVAAIVTVKLSRRLAIVTVKLNRCAAIVTVKLNRRRD